MRIALGWIGWTPEVAMACDINAILVAYEGRLDMLQAIFGKPKEEAPDLPQDPITPQAFDRMFMNKGKKK